MFAGWGISPRDFPPGIRSTFGPPDFGTLISTWEDDYARIDVRGKVVVLMRLPILRAGRVYAQGPSPEQLLAKALARGPAAVLLIDGSFGPSAMAGGGAVDVYGRMANDDPITSTSGTPVFVLSAAAGDKVMASAGLRPTDVLRAVARGDVSFTAGRSLARPMPVSATVDLPLGTVRSSSHSVIALTPARPDGHRLVLWAIAPSDAAGSRSGADALAAVVRSVDVRSTPGLAFVVLDPRGDAVANAKAIKALLGPATVDAVLVVDTVVGSHLAFQTTYGHLVPVIDDYAARAGATFVRTARSLNPDVLTTGDLMQSTGIAAIPEWPWVLIRAAGTGRDLDRRGDAAAILGYAVSRFQSGAPELVAR